MRRRRRELTYPLKLSSKSVPRRESSGSCRASCGAPVGRAASQYLNAKTAKPTNSTMIVTCSHRARFRPRSRIKLGMGVSITSRIAYTPASTPRAYSPSRKGGSISVSMIERAIEPVSLPFEVCPTIMWAVPSAGAAMRKIELLPHSAVCQCWPRPSANFSISRPSSEGGITTKSW